MPVIAESDGKPPGEYCRNDLGWNETAQQFHVSTKSFNFPSITVATSFCVEILTFPHSEKVQLSAFEERAGCKVHVAIHVQAASETEKKQELERMIHSVEEMYHDVTRPKRSSIWPWSSAG